MALGLLVIYNTDINRLRPVIVPDIGSKANSTYHKHTQVHSESFNVTSGS